MAAPLYDLLLRLAAEGPLRLDMPGHHGAPLPGGFPWPSALDFTENGATGDLYGEAEDAIAASEALWAARMGFGACLYLTGGSTQGIHAGLALLAGAGGRVAMDRGCHRSVWNALALLDLAPEFLPRPWLEEEGVAGPIAPESVERVLSARPEIKTVCITSPTYYGVLSDIPAIAAVCRAHGARLLVDGAHGAHLPFLGYAGYSAADAAVVSAHKTLPAPGQTALLLANGFGLPELKRVGAVYGTSSPSYVMMAALDRLGEYMDGEGAARYREAARLTAALRVKYRALTDRPGLALDPTRLALRSGDGFTLARRLREKGVYPEMADAGHVVCILTCADAPGDFARLEAALAGEDLAAAAPVCPPPPAPPRAVLTPRQALFAPRESVPLEEAEGRTAACQLAPYPPGVPVVAPGEEIAKKYLAYLRRIGYNRNSIEVVRRDGPSKGGVGREAHHRHRQL